jgi:mono/diheme cytochrome c family protein
MTPGRMRAAAFFVPVLVSLCGLPLAARQGAQPPQAPATRSAPDPKRVEAGAALYRKKGCYECHVEEAQGGPQGPRLGPNPIPQARFVAYVRNPTGDMPPFTARVLSEEELGDIYAFLQARPQPKPVSTVPLLAQ